MPLLEPAIAYVGGRRQLRAVTETDRLWLLRAVQSEGCDRRLVAQTLLNRWAFLGESGDGRGLTALVRAYCQPLHNPQSLASQRTGFDAATFAAVDEALAGPAADFPAGAVHFAAVNYTPQGSRQALVWSDGECNSLYKVPASEGFLYRAQHPTGGRVPRWLWLGAGAYIVFRLLKG